jgi:F-type H+-transporting ATPase subunit c
MLETLYFTKAALFLGAGLSIGFGAIGAAVGEGYAAGGASESIAYRPEKSGEILKNMLVGQAIAESAAIFALVVAIILVFSDAPKGNFLMAFNYIGAGLAMGLSAIGSGVGAGLPAGKLCLGIVRQPAHSSKLVTTMLIGSAVCQTPAIFGMVVAFLLLFLDYSTLPFNPGWAAMLGAGLSTGLAATGPGIGNGLTAMEAVTGASRHPETNTDTNRVMLVGLSVAQSTAIYGFVISLLLLFMKHEASTEITRALALLGAGAAMGFGGIGPGIGEGITAAGAVKWISRNREATGVLTRTMLVGMAVAESTGIYSLIVALLLVVVL